MTKHYKNEGIMKVLTILGAIIGLVYIINGFTSLAGYSLPLPVFVSIDLLNRIVTLIIGLVVVILTLLVAWKPNKPLPFHWLVLLILAILLVLLKKPHHNLRN